MYNDRLSTEEAKERITQRVKEVETYTQQKGFGMSDHGVARWILAFIILASVVAGSLL